jgi:hypothetical protein
MADAYLLGCAAKKNVSDDRAFERMFEENFEIPEKIKILE